MKKAPDFRGLFRKKAAAKSCGLILSAGWA